MVWTPRHGEGSARPRFPLAAWLFPIILVGIAILLEAGGDATRLALRYERAAVATGDFWRLLTGHLVHLGPPHLAMNAAGLVLVWALCGNRMSLLRWVGITVLVMLAIDLGFWLLMPGLAWYVGLSGVLHGLLVAGAVAGLDKYRGESIAILLLVFLKVGWEQVAGSLPGSEATAGGPVVVEAHLYGAIAGLLAAFPNLIRAGRDPGL